MYFFITITPICIIIGIITPTQKEKKPHIKKPLNAFMLFMKEKRAEVIKECTLKESAAINQILGKMVSTNMYMHTGLHMHTHTRT